MTNDIDRRLVVQQYRGVRHILLSLVLAASLPAGLSAEGMTAGDRQRLLAHLEMTESWLVS